MYEEANDENAMKFLDRAMQVRYPMISFVTGASEGSLGQKHSYYEADLGNMFRTLLANDHWNPHNQCVGYMDDGVGVVKYKEYKVSVWYGIIAPRFDEKYERINAYRHSYCVAMLYTALSMHSFEHMKQRIEELHAICSSLLHIQPPPIVIVGVHYHCDIEDIQVPFSVVEEYASSINVKAYQTFGSDQAEQARSVMRDIVQVFIDKGLLLKDGDAAGWEHTKKMFYGVDEQVKKSIKKRNRCIVM